MRGKQKETTKNIYEKIHKEQGITLIALVITIVVLIILATVAISTVFGEGGLIERSELAKKLTANNMKAEEESLANLEALFEPSIDENYEPITYSFEDINIRIDVENIQEGMFQVNVANEDGQDILAGTNDKSGKIELESKEITLEGPKTYTFYIYQYGHREGYVMDETKHIIKVRVEVKDGKLVAKADKTDIIFKNIYKAKPTSVTLGAAITYSGAELLDKQFEFILKDSTGRIVDTVYNSDVGQITFKTLLFNAEGEYTYTISQVNKGNANITYDDSIYTVNIIVTDNGEGDLLAEVSYGEGKAPVFHNEYEGNGTDKPQKPEEPKQL